MSSRSLNKVQLIGNVAADVEVRYTATNSAFCSFALITNRSWKTENGEVKEDSELHRLIAWGKLAELCGQLIHKGTKLYIEGRLSTRSFTDKSGSNRTSTEVVIEDMILLESKKKETEEKQEEKKEAKASPASTQTVVGEFAPF